MQHESETSVPLSQNTPKKSSGLGIALALFLSMGAFFSGFQTNTLLQEQTQTASLFSFFSPQKTEAEMPVEADLTEFWSVWKLLESKFISASSTKVVTTEEKINGAIEGLVRSYGDPYTVFLPPVQSEAFAQDISGNFSGIGMEVGMKNDVITVIAPLADTPAERAGLLSGDLIIKIDDRSTEAMSIDEAVRLIRGEKGTVVTLSIFREGELEIREIAVTRDTITVPTVTSEIVDGVFVIDIDSFNAVSEEKMQEALRKYVASDATEMIIDVRGNPGGYLQSAVSIASFFLPTGKVVVRERQGDNEEERLYRSQGRTLDGRAPKSIVVLVDTGSASASEILAGALREHGLATLIGNHTFGKGSVQELVPLPDGSSLKVTVARWFTPNGVSISDGGLKPDITINRTPEQRLNDEDPQLSAALRYLKGEKVESEVE